MTHSVIQPSPAAPPLAASFGPSAALRPRLRGGIGLLATGLFALAGGASAPAETIAVPNYSFESQVATGNPAVTIDIDHWQKTPMPDGFVSALGYSWDQQMGIFGNTPEGASNHIENLDQNQSTYLFDVPGVGIFQDNNSTDWQNAAPSHAFNAIYQAGQSYQLTLGVIGGGGGMTSAAVLDLILYYRDAQNNMVTLADTPLTFSLAAFPNTTQLADFSVNVPALAANSPAVGKNIGIEFLSTAGEGYGYWDVDNVRLTAAPEPGSIALLGAGLAGLLTCRPRRRATATA